MYVRTIFTKLNLIRFDFSRDHSDMQRTLNTSQYYPGNFYKRSLQLGKNLDRHVKPLYKFCVVRNPFSWYESYWRFMQDRNWSSLLPTQTRTRFGFRYDQWHPFAPLELCADPDFNHFMEKVIEKQPGYLTRLFESYADPQHISYVAKQETLEDDLRKIFDQLNVKYDNSVFASTEKVNASKTSKPTWDEGLRKSICSAEAGVFEKYSYDI